VLTVTLVERAAGRVPPEVFAQTVRLLTDPTVPTGAAGVLAQKVVKAMTLSNAKLAALVLVAAGLAGGGTLLVPAAGGPPLFRAGAPVGKAADAGPHADLVLKGHTGAVHALAFRPDGQRLATAGADQTVKVWDASTGKELFTLKDHSMPVQGVAWEPDGRHLLSVASTFDGGGPGEVRRWDAGTGEPVLKLTGHALPTMAVAVSPDGQTVAVGGGTAGQGELSLSDLKTGKTLSRTRANTVWPFLAVDFSPDGKVVAVGGGREVRAFDARAGNLFFQTAEHPDPVYATQFSPDGRRIASAGIGKEKAIRFWDAQTGKKLPTIDTEFRGAIKSLAYSRDGNRLAAGSLDGTARVFDVATGAEQTMIKHDKNVHAVAFSPDGRRLAVALDDSTARVYSLQKPDPAPAKGVEPVIRPDAKGGKAADPAGPDARQTASSFLELAIAGKVKEAREHAFPNHISENKVRDIQELGLKRADVSVALAGATDALVITEPVEVPKEGKGHLLVYLRQKDGKWGVRDLDFEPSDKALRKQRDFLEKYPDAKPVRDRK
jgi:dipeptidyl aminopeptidase/acylaminoacyl peptidase